MPSGVYKRTKKHKKKIKQAMKGKFIGKDNPFHGKKHSQKTKEKIKQAMTGNQNPLGTIPSKARRKKVSKALRGAKSHLWRGGISNYPYPDGWRDTLKESIRQRDNYICQICGIHQDELKGRTKKLDIHHIDYDKDNLNPNNLISLCRSCHVQTNSNRDYWIKYFQEKIGWKGGEKESEKTKN